jgi:putative tryptophan/tyrosine transport system substrate-binding protein
VPLVGVLMPFEKGDEEAERRQSAFQNGLEQFGWRNGQNIRIEYRWAGGDPNRYQSHAAELVGLAPDVILAPPFARKRTRYQLCLYRSSIQ